MFDDHVPGALSLETSFCSSALAKAGYQFTIMEKKDGDATVMLQGEPETGEFT